MSSKRAKELAQARRRLYGGDGNENDVMPTGNGNNSSDDSVIYEAKSNAMMNALKSATVTDDSGQQVPMLDEFGHAVLPESHFDTIVKNATDQIQALTGERELQQQQYNKTLNDLNRKTSEAQQLRKHVDEIGETLDAINREMTKLEQDSTMTQQERIMLERQAFSKQTADNAYITSRNQMSLATTGMTFLPGATVVSRPPPAQQQQQPALAQTVVLPQNPTLWRRIKNAFIRQPVQPPVVSTGNWEASNDNNHDGRPSVTARGESSAGTKYYGRPSVIARGESSAGTKYYGRPSVIARGESSVGTKYYGRPTVIPRIQQVGYIPRSGADLPSI